MKKIQGLIISLMLVFGISSQGAFAATASDLTYNPDGTIAGFSLPGISSPDFPNIYNDAKVRWYSGRYGSALTASSGWGADMFFTRSVTDGVPDVYQITDASFRLYAIFNKAGDLLGGSLKIRGTLNGPDFSGSGTLVTADLSSFAFTDGLIGFNTVNLQCMIIGIDCTVAESVYLRLDNGGFSTDLRRYSSTALAVTNLPVPAAIVLFGSGLIGLVGLGRRRKALKTEALVA